MIEQGPWGRNQIAKDINWGVAPLPVGPQAKGAGTLLITDSLAVFKGTGVEDQAIDLAKWLTNPENQFTYEKTHGLTPLRPVAGVKDLVKEDPTLEAVPRRHRPSVGPSRCSLTTRASRTPSSTWCSPS